VSKRSLFIAGFLAFFIGVLAIFPARVAYRWFSPPTVALAGIEGTVWSGRADHASVSGVYVRNLEWSARPLSLLMLRPTYHARGELVSGFVEGIFSVGLGNRIRMEDVSASVSLSTLAEAVNLPQLSGTANLRLDALDIRAGVPVAATGTVEVSQLFVPAIYRRAPIGGYRAEFFTQPEGIVASVEDTDGIIDVAGSLTVGADRNYVFLAAIAPKDGADEGLRNQMRFLGTPDERGQYELRLEGTL
jgi:general secretion pathway protein N